ncbi:MAG: response regulator [Spirochaetia bacterium]|jgi:two-component sensor histidine kinase/DNA-binding NarL/FixJ family response regulator|nr:response regulator [Spirochaetia bacterium]
MQKVLVVDNNPVVLQYMETFLSKNGYTVKTAENGLIALDIVKDYIPDYVFVDLIMPYIKGELLVSILKERKDLSETSIIILSGVAAEIELDYIAMGADACIAKGPFNSMGKHISHVLNELAKNGSNQKFKQVIGLEDVFKRSITEELMVAKLHGEVILEGISDCIIELSIDYRIVYINNAALNFLNKSEKNVIASNLLNNIDSEWHGEIIDFLEKIKNGDTSKSIELNRGNEYFLITAKYLNSTKDNTIVLIIKDISLHKQREEELKKKISEREMMIKEVYHRVKNNLAMVSSIINLQLGESDNVEAVRALNDLRSRIDSISMVHAKLFRGKDLNNINLDDYIMDLVANLIDSFVHSELTIAADITFPEVAVDFDKAVPLGIIITELTTNALKYAYEGQVSGLISISYLDKGENIEIIFADNGKGLSSDLSVEGAETLGFNLITTLVMQLQGSVNVENKNGAVFTITLPRL